MFFRFILVSMRKGRRKKLGLTGPSAFSNVINLPNINEYLEKTWEREVVRSDPQWPGVVDLTLAELLDEKTNRGRYFKAVEECEIEHLQDHSQQHEYDVSPGGNPKIRRAVMEYLWHPNHKAIKSMGYFFAQHNSFNFHYYNEGNNFYENINLTLPL